MFSHKKKWNIKIVADKKNKKVPKRVWVYLFFIILCIVGVVHVLRLPEYQIRKVIVSGAVLTRESDVRGIAEEYLSYSYFYFIPQSNIWLYPKNKILDSIMSLSSIDGVDLDLNKRNNVLEINIKERKHEYVWCDSNNSCFYMDRDGYIFSNAPTFEGNVFLTFRGLIDDNPIGKSFLEKNKMSELLSLITELNSFNLHTSAVNILSYDEVVLTLSTKANIVISINKQLGEALKNIKILINSGDFKAASGGGITNIEQIDMRYGKKAFWK
jgi:cell division septal protein FtsQ